jgi:hypothetical protein
LFERLKSWLSLSDQSGFPSFLLAGYITLQCKASHLNKGTNHFNQMKRKLQAKIHFL